jgi:hypothetical protein
MKCNEEVTMLKRSSNTVTRSKKILLNKTPLQQREYSQAIKLINFVKDYHLRPV